MGLYKKNKKKQNCLFSASFGWFTTCSGHSALVWSVKLKILAIFNKLGHVKFMVKLCGHMQGVNIFIEKLWPANKTRGRCHLVLYAIIEFNNHC